MRKLYLVLIGLFSLCYSLFAAEKVFTIPSDVYAVITFECEIQRVPLDLTLSVFYEESRFNIRAVNRKEARGYASYGIAQLNSEVAEDIIKRVGTPGVKYDYKNNPIHNAVLGVRQLRWLMNQIPDDTRLAVAAYNCGIGRATSTRGPPVKTLAYVDRIFRRVENERIKTQTDSSNRLRWYYSRNELSGNRSSSPVRSRKYPRLVYENVYYYMDLPRRNRPRTS